MTRNSKRTFDAKKAVRHVVLASVCLVLALGLLGCRPSHKLEKIRYTYSADLVEQEVEQINQETDGRLEEYLHNVQQEEALSVVDEDFIAQYQANAGNNGQAASLSYDGSAGDGQAVDRPAEGNTGQGHVTTQAGDQKSPDAESELPDTGEESSGAGNNDQGEQKPDTGNEGDQQLPTPVPRPGMATGSYVDASGEVVDLPVRAKKVAAVGNIAQIVEMVGGPNRLAGTDAKLLSNSVAQQVFTDYSQIKQWWSGDGSSPMSEECFAELLADPEIGVVFGESGKNTFSQDQIDRLNEMGVYYVALNPFSTFDGLKENVEVVGYVMDNNLYDADSKTRAANYTRWVDNLLSEVSSKTSSYVRLTTYVAGWDDNVSYRLVHAGFFSPDDPDAEFGLSGGWGSGLAYGYSTNHSELFTEAANAAHVLNMTTNFTIGHRPASDYVYVSPCFQTFFVEGGLHYENASYDYSDSNKAPGYSEFLSVPGSGFVTAYNKNGQSIGSVPASSEGSSTLLGKSDFPAIIVKDTQIASKIQSNVFWNYHGYGGPLQFVPSYRIYVNPVGLSDWAEGGVESPLEAVWLANKLCGAYSGTEVKEELSQFYYNYFNARPSQDVLSDIVGS